MGLGPGANGEPRLAHSNYGGQGFPPGSLTREKGPGGDFSAAIFGGKKPFFSKFFGPGKFSPTVFILWGTGRPGNISGKRPGKIPLKGYGPQKPGAKNWGLTSQRVNFKKRGDSWESCKQRGRGKISPKKRPNLGTGKFCGQKRENSFGEKRGQN